MSAVFKELRPKGKTYFRMLRKEEDRVGYRISCCLIPGEQKQIALSQDLSKMQ